jgi:hypothetical protein
LLTFRGFGKDGKPVATEMRQMLQANQNVDASFQTRFQGPVSKVEAVISAGLVEREFPFSLARGMTAGAPSTATAAIKPAATTSSASGTSATAPPAPTPPAPAAPLAAPKAAIPAKPEAAPIASFKTEMPAVPKRPSRAHLDARECLKQPTDKAIMACAERFR